MNSKISFQKDSEFTKELKTQVQAYLNNDPRGRLADTNTWLKAISLILICSFLYLCIIFLKFNFLERTGLVIIFSFFTLILGLNVMHDSVHGNYSKYSFINQIMAFTFEIFGVSSDLFNIKHNHFHHNYTNIFGHDGDISETPIIRMSTKQKPLPLHRFQVFYTPFLYSLITITWPMNDIRRLVKLDVAKKKFKRPSFLVTCKILFFKIINFYLTYFLPVQKFGLKQGLFFVFLFHMVLGFILTLIFQVAHVHKNGFHESEQTDWHIHQLNSSADFGTQSAVTNFLMGGLNFQVIHHLFPNVCFRHFPEIKKIVKNLCKKYNLKYNEFNNLSEATIQHFKWLKQVSI